MWHTFLQLLSESLDVIQSPEWTIRLGNALSMQYDLYVGDHQHSAMLHRWVGASFSPLTIYFFDYVTSVCCQSLKLLNEMNKKNL